MDSKWKCYKTELHSSHMVATVRQGVPLCDVSASSLVVSIGQAVDVASARISLEKVCIQVLNCNNECC